MRASFPRFLGACLAPLPAACLLALLWFPAFAAAEEHAPLKVGLEDYYPPFALTDETGRHSGFDHEIGEALCNALSRPCDMVVLPFDDLLAAMRRGELDMLIDGLAPSADRLEYMDFTDSYYRSRSIYIGRPGQTIDVEGLRGKKIGSQIDTLQGRFLQEHWGNVADVTLLSYEEVLGKLYSGELDVALVDGLPGYAFLKSEQGSEFVVLDDPLPPNTLLSEARIGVRKGDDKLREALNKAIVHIRLNGEYDRITRKYFAFSIY